MTTPGTSVEPGSTSGEAFEATPTRDATTLHPPLRRWAAVAAIGIGIFTLVTIEELPIGVLTLIADDLGVSRGVVGLAVTLPGVLAAVIALVAPVITRRLDRRLVLVLALAAVVVSCGLSVLSTGMYSLLFSRIFAGIAIGLYWPAMPVITVRQVPAERSAAALTVAFAGTGGALVLGVPLASWLGSQLGWRESFMVVGGIALLVLVAVLLLVRPVHADEPTHLGDLLAAFQRRGVRYAVVMAGLLVSGQFLTYSYVSPLLQEAAGLEVDAVAPMLLVFGVAGLIGNFAAAPLLRRSPGAAVITISVGIAAALLAIELLVHGPSLAVVLVAVWGLFGGAISVVMQTFVTRYAGRYEESATALNSTIFNLSIAMGALVGGRLIDTFGVRAPAWVSVVLIACAGVLAVRWIATGGQRRQDEIAA